MTDILDLDGWHVIANRLDDDECVIEAEYAVPPKACTKCGNIGNLYKHGPKPLYIRDSPIRGRCVSWLMLSGSSAGSVARRSSSRAQKRNPSSQDAEGNCAYLRFLWWPL